MKKIIMAVIAVAVSSGVADAFELANMGVKDVAKAAQETQAAVKLPEAKFGQLMDLTRDCKKITFRAADALISPEVSLVSSETTQECQNMGYPVGQICFPNTRYYRENVKVVITEPRVLQPDQKEVFEVCLWGAFLSLKQVSPAYTYAVRQVPGAFELTPAGDAAKAVKSAPAGVDFAQWRTLKATAPTGKGPVWLQGDNPYGDVFISENAVIYNTAMESRPLTKKEKASLANAIETEIEQGSLFRDKLSIALNILRKI